jgi:hypothetical protein
MNLTSFESLVTALDRERVRYIVVGGLAVAAHGYVRATRDVDLVVQLVHDNVQRAFTALSSLGYKPLVPITVEQFADAALRNSWIRDKGMRVLNFWSDAHRETPVDLFVAEPFDFEEEYNRTLNKSLYGTTPVRFASIRTLIRMKEAAGRAQDVIDVENLRMRLDDDANG